MELARERLAAGRWPIYRATPNRAALAADDAVAIYLAGHALHSGCVVARTTIVRVRTWRSGSPVDPTKYDTDRPDFVLELGPADFLNPPVELRPLLPLLSIAPKNLSNWGSVLQGGCRRLTIEDWRLLTG